MTMTKQKSNAFGKDIYLLGKDDDGQKHWLEAPKWDCGWYWGFGYIETYTNNKNPHLARDISGHSHWDSHDYTTILTSKTFSEGEGWELRELFAQFYFMRQAAEIFNRGKAHQANTKLENWKKPALVKEINEKRIPAITARILEILTPVA